MRSSGRLGFTLIETIFALALLAFFFGIGVISYRNLNQRQLVTQNTLKVVESLRFAQSMAMNNQKTCGVGTLEGYLFERSGNSYDIKECCSGTCNTLRSDSIASDLGVSGFTQVKFLVLRRGVECLDPCELTISLGSFSKKIIVEKGGVINVE